MGDDAIAPMESGDITIAAMDHLDDAMVLEHEAEVRRNFGAFSHECYPPAVEDVEDVIEVPEMCGVAWYAINLHLEETNVPVAAETRAFQVDGKT